MAHSGWTPCRLGDLVKIEHGWPFKSELFTEERTGRPIVVGVGNFRYTGGFRFAETPIKEYRGSYPKQFELAPGDVLLVMTCQTAGGEILGIPAKIPDDGRVYLHNQRLGKVTIRDRSRADLDFLYWMFLWSKFNRELVTSASGTKILHTAPSRIEAFNVLLPPIDEQRAIAAILGFIQRKIELNRQMSETLSGIGRAIFKSWFIDFDPVHDKAEGRHPSLAPEVAALFPDRLVDSGSGEMPEGWAQATFEEIAKPVTDVVRAEVLSSDEPYIGLEHMPRRSITLAEWGVAAELSSHKARFRRGDILFGKLRPYFHKVGVALIDGVTSASGPR